MKKLKAIWLVLLILTMPFGCRHTRQLQKSTVNVMKDSVRDISNMYKYQSLDSSLSIFNLKNLKLDNNTEITYERGYKTDIDNDPIEITGNFKMVDSPGFKGIHLVDSASGKQINVTDKGATIKDPNRKPKTIPYEKFEFKSNSSLQQHDSSGTLAAKHDALIDTSKHDSTHVKKESKKENKSVNSDTSFMNNPLTWIGGAALLGAIIWLAWRAYKKYKKANPL